MTGRRRVAILGGGPIGLDAALAFADAGAEVTVLEAGPAPGTHVRAWGHVRLFTPWSMNVSDRMRRHLTAVGVAVPDGDARPTGHELADQLLDPLAALLGDVVRTGVRVLGVARRGLLKHEAIGGPAREAVPFRILVTDGTHEWTEEADVVLDCTGNYATPNALGDGGVPAPGEGALSDTADRIVRHLPDSATLDAWAGHRVLLVGSGKSAQTAARELALRRSPVLWAVRDPAPDWGEIPDDTLPERQELVEVAELLRAGGAREVEVLVGARVEALWPGGVGTGGDGTGGNGAGWDGAVVASVVTSSGAREVVVDRVLALTGYVGDAELYRQLQVHECYATGAPMSLAAALLAAAGDGPADCLAQPAQGVDVLRSSEPDFFVLGAKSYGRNSAFLLRVGYEQVDEVVGAYTGGIDTARQPA